MALDYYGLKSGSHLPKKFICVTESPLKMDEKCFLFHLESPFRSFVRFDRFVEIFVLTFWSNRKNGLIRKIRVISNFMTSQPGQQIITIHIFPNISRIKGNQTMKFGQLIEYNKGNIFL